MGAEDLVDGPGRDRQASPHERRLAIAVAALVVQSAWLAARADPTPFYYANVAAHFGLGLVLTGFVARWAVRLGRPLDAMRLAALTGTVFLAVSAGFATALFAAGNTRPHRWLLQAHVAFACAALVLLIIAALLRARTVSSRAFGLTCGGLAAALALGTLAFMPVLRPAPEERIANPELPPATMEEEAMGGAEGPFFPSSVHTTTGGRIPSGFFLGSEGCGRSGCHADITAQWRSSAHHFASFNNQFYRKSIEYMQSVVGVTPSKWCAGCHDVALLLDGKFDRPIADILKDNPSLPEAHAGLACTACHAITKVHGGSMGQGGYTIEYPPLHDLATSDNALLRLAHDVLLRLDPAPHARTFLKPFHGQQHAEFCSSCHKVHLDKPVNDYRWVRGFNDYDNWQASGVSGQGARAFYYPEKSADCVDCHMPLVDSQDKGNKKGRVHEHRFIAANTALTTANQDSVQFEKTAAFLRDKVTVDVFALSRAGAVGAAEAAGLGSAPRPGAGPEPSAHFPAGEEQEMSGPVLVSMETPVDVIAPLGRGGVAVRRGESVRIDVVVRTRGVGHFFPGGTVDSFDVWVELKAEDETGRPIFWSGRVEDEGKGPVEKGAHFYRSLMIDEHGNPINKRNAWAARAVVYARLVPPGAADTVRYRMEIPADCGNEIRLKAQLHYRKFSHYYTQFAYAGEPSVETAAASVAHGHDDREFVFTADTASVSGKIKEVPDLPIITLNSSEARLTVIGADEPLPEPPAAVPDDRGRWNDYGIGMLLAGDLRAALHAFERVCELDPAYADGFVNIARVRVREGDADAALAALARANAIKPGLARSQFLEGQALKLQGRLPEALAAFERAAAQHPRDRVVLNELSRTCFLLRDHAKAVEWGRKVLEVDPEDVRAHYTLMLASRGLGDEAGAKAHEQRYLRFKADEDAQVITGEYRRLHPEDNNERQSIHEHVSVALDALVTAAASAEAAGQ